MFKGLFGRKQSVRDAHALYGAVVARSRNEQFFTDFSVPDTFDGRFEMLVMHLFMFHNRLKNESADIREVSQCVFDRFLSDMDRALRDVGVGDQVVPKRIAKMTRVFYGRTGAYETALAEQEPLESVAAVIERNLFPEGDSDGRERPLAHYMVSQVKFLEKNSVGDIINSQQVFASFTNSSLDPSPTSVESPA